jgi:putative chitinase
MAIDRETQVLTDATAAGITQPRELANYMAQVTHESNGLSRLEESFRFMRGIAQIPVRSAWREGTDVLDGARREALQGRPEKLAELMHGGRQGNDQPGDGYLYRGRGYIQLTGKDNYRAAGEALDLDLVGKPDLAADPKHASKIAAWYWTNHVPPEVREDVKGATQAINGKLHGLEDRQQRFGDWQKRLTPEVMDRLASGGVGRPVPDPVAATATAVASSSVTAGIAGVLREGSRGEGVRHLQTTLASLGYTDEDRRPLKADGHFGPGTRTALKTFQISTGQEPSGEANTDLLNAVQHEGDLLEAGRRRHRHHHPHGGPQPYLLDQPSHPDHKLFQQAREAVHAMDAQHHRKPDERSENLAAALTVAARANGMQRIDHVALNNDASKVYAVEGDLQSPHKRVAEVDTEKAIATPVPHSSLNLASKTAEHDHAQQQAQPTQQPHPATPSHGMP